MKKITLLVLIPFIGISIYAQNKSATKNYNSTNKFTSLKVTKSNFNKNIKSTNAYIFESFEGTTFPPTGWTIINPTGGTGWARQVVGATLPNWSNPTGGTAVCPAAPTGGGNAYAIANWNTGSSGTTNDQWLISPAITISTGDMLYYNLMMYSTAYQDSFDVLISTSPTSFTTVLADYDSTDFIAVQQTWVPVSISLSAYIGQTVYIAFREHIFDNVNNGSLFCLDLVSIGTAPPCDVAVQSIDMSYLNAPTITTPKATVINIGSTTQTFNVTMTINPGGYSNTQTVTALGGGLTQQVTFASWTPVINTNYQIIVTATLAGDVDLSNNSDTMNATCLQIDPVLFDNTAIAADNSIISMKFGGLTAGTDIIQGADDFDVSANTTWTVTSIYVNGYPNATALTTTIDSFAVYIYSDNSAVPGTLLHKASIALAMEGTNLDTTQTLVLSNPITLTSGKYWISVFAVYDTATGQYACRWNWKCGPANIGDTSVLQTTTTLFGSQFAWTRLWDLGVAGEKSFYFTINGTSGCVNSPVYVSYISAAETATGALNGSIDITAHSGTMPYSFNWSNGSTTEDIYNLSEGYYNVTVSDYNGCSSVASIYVANSNFNYVPIGTLSNIPQTTFLAFSYDSVFVYNVSFVDSFTVDVVWAFLQISTGTIAYLTETYTVNNQGYYTVAIAVTCNPKKSTNVYYGHIYLDYNDIISSINSNKLSKNYFEIYPVPFENVINIKFNSLNNEVIDLKLFNVFGQMVFSKQINIQKGLNNISLNTDNLSKGIYLIQISSNDKIITKKIVK